MPNALLIEDEAQIARLLLLEFDHAGWLVTWRKTGRAGVAEARASTYDVVILDLMLPDINGMDLCPRLRKLSDVPILILTARDAVEDRVAGLDAGADDYLVKPFATAELLARLRALQRRRKAAGTAQDWFVAGNIRLSVLRHEVQIAEQTADLTPREFNLLQYLLENIGIALTREMILDRIWGWGYDGANSIVDVYVCYLRNKLERLSATMQIATVRGVGYTLKPIQDG